ncbi:MAG: amidohydrolase [Thermoplasmata archaeon]
MDKKNKKALCFINGEIYVSFDPVKKVNAIVLINGMVKYAGNNKKAIEMAKSNNYEIIDLKKQTVIPGFIDSHMHLDGLIDFFESIDLSNAKSVKQILKILNKYKKSKKNGWIIGHGFDQEKFRNKKWPTCKDLDKVSCQIPIFISRICMHAGVMNTKAKQLLSLNTENKNTDGIVKEKSFFDAYNKIKQLNTSNKVDIQVISIMNYIVSLGITSIGYMNCSKDMYKILTNLSNKKKIHVRIYVYQNPDDRLIGKPSSKIKINGIKLFVDGSLGANTALLYNEYKDKNTKGILSITDNEIQHIANRNKGLQMACHAIGDKALDVVLSAYSSLNGLHRIEHASLIKREQIKKIKKTDSIIVSQPFFIMSDYWLVDKIGVERIKNAYIYKTILKNSIPLAFSSDAPIGNLNPIEGIYASITRGKIENYELYKHTKKESLTKKEALKCYTEYGSIALKDPHIGKLEVGYHGDFIILNKDPLKCINKDIRSIKVLKTYIGGKCVYNYFASNM